MDKLLRKEVRGVIKGALLVMQSVSSVNIGPEVKKSLFSQFFLRRKIPSTP